jgi:hypothetical protein
MKRHQRLLPDTPQGHPHNLVYTLSITITQSPMSTTRPLPSSFHTKYAEVFRISVVRATFPASRIHLDFSIVVIFGKDLKLRSSSPRNFLRSYFTCSPFGPHTFFSVLFSNVAQEHPNRMKTSKEEKSPLCEYILLILQLYSCMWKYLG